MKAFTPNVSCPVCHTPMHEMAPAGPGEQLDVRGDDSDDVIVLTCCKQCGTLLEYNTTKNSLYPMRQELIDAMPDTPKMNSLLLSSLFWALGGKD